MDINKKIVRCSWCLKEDIYIKYHDEEWGVPVHDEIKHFEFLLLETMQAGLSWLTILKRRENYRQAFANFDPNVVACFDKTDVVRLMQDSGIIRNLRKIEAAIINAQKFLKIQEEFGLFDKFIWGFTDGKVVRNSWETVTQIQPTTALSDRVTKELKLRGFKFVGSTTVYAHLQAIGVVNDHVVDCFRSKILCK
ncbi:MAG: DNA-3-methyladenine glycosylase I [Burkholderiales bacterium]|nr:DNA-3-methyladenine glycosylase I [Burkholderiales bacterium]